MICPPELVVHYPHGQEPNAATIDRVGRATGHASLCHGRGLSKLGLYSFKLRNALDGALARRLLSHARMIGLNRNPGFAVGLAAFSLLFGCGSTQETSGGSTGSGGSSSGGSGSASDAAASDAAMSTTGAGGSGGSGSGGMGGTGAVPPDLDWRCDGDACVPGAKCDESTGFCECADGYAGDGWWCLSTAPCADSPCQNGGTCHPTLGARVLCSCPAGWGGVHCEIACSGEIEFPDAAFASVVRSAASIEEGQPITAEALADVTSLTISGTPISDLTGIECMPSLSWITIREAGLTSLTPFAALPRLTSLQVDCNSITDLSPIASLINLVDLNVGKSSSCEVPGQVTDASALEDLVGLSTLDLSGHDLSSLDSLRPLTHLQWLILASNANLASLDGIENADYLGYFVATDTSVSDVSLFAGHQALETLWLSGSRISDLGPLLTASALAQLYIRATEVDCQAQAENLSALQANGVSVTSDCD